MSRASEHTNPLLRFYDRISWFLQLNLGLILTAVGIHFFKTPNHFAFGGTSGLSIVMAELFPDMSVGGAMFAVNAALVIVGLIFLGVRTMGITIYSSFALSAYVSICEWAYDMSAGPFTDETFLELCFAVVLPAVGAALAFNAGASTGGTDIIAMIMAKSTSLPLGTSLLISDLLLVIAAGFVFGISTLMFCLAGLYAKAFVVDSMIESINLRKQCTIVTRNGEPIKQFILHELGRGATVHSARGAYSNEPMEVITSVLTRKQAMLLRNFIHTNDPHAFITIVNSSEVLGKGFRAIK